MSLHHIYTRVIPEHHSFSFKNVLYNKQKTATLHSNVIKYGFSNCGTATPCDKRDVFLAYHTSSSIL